MRWWKILGRRRQFVTPDEDGKEAEVDLAEAQRQRQAAEQKLRETRTMSSEVTNVANTSKRIRQQNHFAARIEEAWGRPTHG